MDTSTGKLTVPGATIEWEAVGSGPAVLLVMGHAFGRGMWHRVVDDLKRDHRVITFDNRGCGGTRTDGSPFTIADMAADGLAVLDAAGEERAHVYGASLGGLIVQEIALQAPDRVRSLIVGCSGCRPVEEIEIPSGWKAKVRSVVYHMPPRVLAWTIGRKSYAATTPADRIAQDVEVIRNTPLEPRALKQQGLAGAAYASQERIGELRMPTLVIHGTEDDAVPIHLARRLRDGIAGARMVEIEGARHNYLTDAPEIASSTLREFLASVEATSS